jgi:hypothetical protein
VCDDRGSLLTHSRFCYNGFCDGAPGCHEQAIYGPYNLRIRGFVCNSSHDKQLSLPYSKNSEQLEPDTDGMALGPGVHHMASREGTNPVLSRRPVHSQPQVNGKGGFGHDYGCWRKLLRVPVRDDFQPSSTFSWVFHKRDVALAPKGPSHYHLLGNHRYYAHPDYFDDNRLDLLPIHRRYHCLNHALLILLFDFQNDLFDRHVPNFNRTPV